MCMIVYIYINIYIYTYMYIKQLLIFCILPDFASILGRSGCSGCSGGELSFFVCLCVLLCVCVCHSSFIVHHAGIDL